MPVTVTHALSMTTPDNTAYENRPSHWNSAHAVSLSISATEISGLFSNANGVSFGMSNNSITASHNALTTAAASNHSHGNPTLALTNLTGTTASNSAGFTLSLSAAGAGVGADGGVGISAGGNSVSSGTVVFSNSNGISFGLNGSTVTAQHNAITTARASTDAIGLNTAGTNITWTANSSGLSINNSGLAGTATAVTGGAAITLNSAGLSFNGASLAGTTSGFTGANLSATITHNTAGLALSMSAAAPGAATLTVSAVGNTTVNSSGTWPGALSLRAYGILSAGTSNGSLLLSTPDPVDFTYLSVGNSNIGNTAGDTGVFSHRLVLVGSNNITLSGSSNAGSATISIIGAAGGAGASFGVSNVGNTSGNTGLTGSNLVLSGGNGVTLSQSTHANGATVGVSVATSYAASNHSHGNPTLNLTNLTGTTASASNGLTLSLSAAAPQTGISGMIVSDATYTSGTVSFSNQNGVTIGSSVNGASQYVRLSVATSYRASNDAIGLNTAQSNVTWTVNSSGLSLDARGYAGTATALTGAIAATVNSAGVSVSVPATSSLVGVGGISLSTNGSTISVSFTKATDTQGYFPGADLELVTGVVGQGSLLFDPNAFPLMQFDRVMFPVHHTNATNSSGSFTLSAWLGLYTRNASTLSLLTSASVSTNVTGSGTQGSYSLYSNVRHIAFPLTATLTEGKYWMGFVSRTTSGGADCSVSNVVLSQNATAFNGIFGSSDNATRQFTLGQGYYTATTSGMPGSVAFSAINGTNTNAGRMQALLFASGTI